MSRYISFIKLKHLIFLNGGSTTYARSLYRREREKSSARTAMLHVRANIYGILATDRRGEQQLIWGPAITDDRTTCTNRVEPRVSVTWLRKREPVSLAFLARERASLDIRARVALWSEQTHRIKGGWVFFSLLQKKVHGRGYQRSRAGRCSWIFISTNIKRQSLSDPEDLDHTYIKI
jgi:hypothetical protein